MAAIGSSVLVLAFVVVAPLALYWFVREEDPDPTETTSWDEATEQATRDRFGGGRAADDRDDRRGSTRDDRGRRTRDGDDDGNHWG